jgi:hypothetical protein
MIWLLKPDQPKATEFAPAMDDSTGILPGLPSVKGKPVHVAFDGGRMTSDAGILLLAAIEQRLGIAERLADCIECVHGLLGKPSSLLRRKHRHDHRRAAQGGSRALLTTVRTVAHIAGGEICQSQPALPRRRSDQHAAGIADPAR